MGKADEIRKKFGSSEGPVDDYSKIITEIEKIASRCESYIHHETLSNATITKLRKEGFTVEYSNLCYTITW